MYRRALSTALGLLALTLLAGMISPTTTRANCSVIPPDGFFHRGFIGDMTSPFLAPNLSNDIRVVGALCEHDGRSAAADFRLDGVELPADEFVITIAFTPQGGVVPAPILVLGADPALCDGVAACTLDDAAEREIVEVPLPGGGVERRLRFRFPIAPPAFGPARLGVKLASDTSPVAAELRDATCSATPAGEHVACIDEHYVQDGSCRTGDAYRNQPFSGLVAIPRTSFDDICTSGCIDSSLGPVSSTLPVTTDRDGNVLFGMTYDKYLVRVDRGDGLIEPRPRRLRLSIDDPLANGFSDADYASKPSSFTEEGVLLSPPFNGFVDPTVPDEFIGIWGMVDAPSGVVFLPRQSCSNDIARSCRANADCASGATCEAPEFDFAQTGQAVELPIADALAQQAVELNSWLNGDLRDPAVALTEDELLAGQPINRDLAADDFVVELLDRSTGLIKRLAGAFAGRGVAQVRVVEGDKDFVVPSIAVENDKIVFLESEFAEGLANPISGTTEAEALAADLNQNGRLDENLRVFELPEDPSDPDARSLLADDLHLSVLSDLRFDGTSNLVLSEGHLLFAYSDIAQRPHGYQLVNQSSDGTPGNFFAGQSSLSSDGGTLAYVSGANNLVPTAPRGPLVTQTAADTVVQAVTTTGDFPEIVDGRAIFEFEASDDGTGSLPSRFHVELKICDTAAGEPDLVALLNLDLTGPNAQIKSEATACSGCSFQDSMLVEFDRGLGKGGSDSYRLVFDSSEIPPAEIGFSFKTGGQADVGVIRGPGCVDPTLEGGVERIYVRDVATGSTEIVSVGDRSDCSEEATASDVPSGNPDITLGGQVVFYDSDASFTTDDVDAESDVYAYDRATCDVTNLSAGVAGPASDPSSSDDGTLVAFVAGVDPEIHLLDRATGVLRSVGPGQDPDLSADGTKLVYTAEFAGVVQVFLLDLVTETTIAVSVLDEGDLIPLGGGAPSAANSGNTAFETPPGDSDAEVLVRDVEEAETSLASSIGIGQSVCITSPCGAFEPSISDDGRFVAFVVRGLLPIDEVMIKNLITGSLTPLSRMAGADGDSFDPDLGASGDFVALSSFASQLGGVSGEAAPNVFLEGPDDASADRTAYLGIIDFDDCGAGTPCVPRLTRESVTRGAVFEGDVAVVGSPVRVVDVGGGGSGYRVTSFGREGVDVALSEDYVCAIASSDDVGNPGHFAACGGRGGSTLTDLSVAGSSLEATEIGLCGARAVALAPDGVLYVADLDAGTEASPVQRAEDFVLGEGQDLDGDGRVDSCLVAFRTLETDLGVDPATVGNRDLDLDDLDMFVLGTESLVTDCQASATDCPGQACELFNYQVGIESVLFITDESEENFGFDPTEDLCSPGTDINEDGLCDLTVRRCNAAGFVSTGTAFGQSANLFSQQRFQNDGENTVINAGFCGTDPANVRLGQLCQEDLDCLSQPGESCQFGFVALSALAESDGDEIPDVFDNCPRVSNPEQADADDDGFGDACDTFNCGDGIVQEAEICDEGPLNGTPGSSCSAQCTCAVNFDVTETLKPGSNGNTPITIYGSAAADGSGCLNLDDVAVGGAAPQSIDPMSLRLSATPPARSCRVDGGGPDHNLDKKQTYRSHLADDNGDGIEDLRVHVDTAPIGGDSSTTVVYLTGRFKEAGGNFGEACFEAVAPVNVSGK